MIGEMLGRRKMIWLAMAFIIVGATLQTSAFTLPHLIVGRIITGLGTGIDSSTVPMYQSELSKKEWRGRLVSWEIFFIGIGIVRCRDGRAILKRQLTSRPQVLAYWIDYGFSYVNSDVAWRTPIGIQLIFAILVTIIVFGLPESPRWLAKRGQYEEAQEVLCAVYDLPPDDEYIRTEMDVIKMAINIEESEGQSSWMNVFKNDIVKTRRRVGLAW